MINIDKLKSYFGTKTVIYCSSTEQQRELFEELDKLGWKWKSKKKLFENPYYIPYFSNHFNLLNMYTLKYGHRGGYEREGYLIINFEDLLWKAGDRIRFKTWEQLAKQYEFDNCGDIVINKTGIRFSKKMKHLCGTEATVGVIHEPRYDGLVLFDLEKFSAIGDNSWSYIAEMFEWVKTEPKLDFKDLVGNIVTRTAPCDNRGGDRSYIGTELFAKGINEFGELTYESLGGCLKGKTFNFDERWNDGNWKIIEKSKYPVIASHTIKDKTITVELSNGRIGTSTCSQNDEFDVVIGTQLAIERAYGKNEKHSNIFKNYCDGIDSLRYAFESLNDVINKNHKFNIGDYVKVIDSGKCCSLYIDFVKNYAPRYVEYFKRNSSPKTEEIYKVVGRYDKTYVVQDEKIKQVFVISEDGLEKYEKPKFVPYLRFYDMTGSHLGNIGEKTNIIDVKGNNLKIGDTVDIYKNGKRLGEYSVCKDDDYFIMSVKYLTFEFGIGFSDDKYSIIKNRDYSQIKHNEKVDEVKYILKED